MNKKFFVGLILGVVTFSTCLNSCSKDGLSNIQNKIVGKWQLVESSDPTSYDPCDYQGWLEFKKDKTYTEFDACQSQNSSGTWKVEENQLTVVSNMFPIPIVITVVSISNTQLVISSSIFGQTETTKYKKI